MFSPEEQKFIEQSAAYLTELTDIEKQMEELNERQRKLVFMLYGKGNYPTEHQNSIVADTGEIVEVEPKKEHSIEDDLIEFLANNPGASRAAIRTFFGKNVGDPIVTNLINSMKKRNLIENRGSKQKPAWYVINN